MRLTIRVDGDDLVASTDDGATLRLDLNGHPDLRDALRDLAGAVPEADDPGAFDGPSAAALASLAEATTLRPRTDPPPPHPVASAILDGRPRVALGPLAGGVRTSAVLGDVLARRRSRRNLAPASTANLAALLVRAGRTRTLAEDPSGRQLESRPFPSAGARHPHELVLASCGVDGLDDAWWWFDPFTCDLVPVAAAPDPDSALVAIADVAAMGRPPTAAVFAAAAFDRTLSRYPAGSTLAWRDAGAVLATLHLVATELGLASCIIGTSGTVRIPAQGHSRPAVDVGAVAIGNVADAGEAG